MLRLVRVLLATFVIKRKEHPMAIEFDNEEVKQRLQYSLIIFLIPQCICTLLSVFVWFYLFGISLVFFIYLNYIPFQLLEHEVKGFQREYRLLDALSKDVDEVLFSGKQIDIRAHQSCDSEINPEVTVILKEVEDARTNFTGLAVLYNARLFLKKLEDYNKKRLSAKCFRFLILHSTLYFTVIVLHSTLYFTVIVLHLVLPSPSTCTYVFNCLFFFAEYVFNCFCCIIKEILQLITQRFNNFRFDYDSFYELKQMEEEINGHLEKKKKGSEVIYGTLERSRAHIRSLQDRPIDEHKSDLDGRVSEGAGLISSILDFLDHTGIEEKIQSIKLQLRLLQAFLIDLQGLEFQSCMEKVWLEEAIEIIDEAQRAMVTFKQRTESWFFPFSKRMARQKLKKDIESIDAGFFHLLNRKKMYGFKFIRRVASKSVTRSPHQMEIQIRNHTHVLNVKDTQRRWLNQVPDSPTGERYHVKSLCNKLDELNSLYEAAKASEGVDNSRTAWLDEMEKNAKELVLTMDDYTPDQAENTYYWEAFLFYTLNVSHFDPDKINSLIPGNNRIYKRVRHQKKLSMLNERMQQVIHHFQRSIEAYSIEVREESVVGLEEDIHELVSSLLLSKPVVSIVGMKGIGKTTLAKMVFNHTTISKKFCTRYWVSIPPQAQGHESSDESWKEEDAVALLKVVAKQVQGPGAHESLDYLRDQGRVYWINKIRNLLREKRYLLVLDNISTKEVWDTLKEAFPETNGRKIVLTTRCKAVADQSGPHQHLLRLRTKEESLKLFTQIVHHPEEKINTAKVVGRCGGLPLAIFHLGYLMLMKQVKDQKSLLDKINDLYKKAWGESATEYKNLPQHLQKCLSYIRLFPRDYEIPARRLVASWVAAGLIPSADIRSADPQSADPESVAEKYLTNLENRYVIQVLKRKLDGNIKTCCLTDALRENGSPLDQTGTEKPREFRPSENQVSILSFDAREGTEPGEYIRNYLQEGIVKGCFDELNVLDLERVFRPILPKTIGNLTTLSYLGLRWTYLETIPSSIAKLTNLQTLDIKHTYIREVPDSIWRLKKLQHLYLNQNYRSEIVHQRSANPFRNLPIVMRQPRSNSLKNLQTLWGVFIDENSFLKDQLDKSTKLKKLELAFQLTSSQQKTLAECVMKLTNLRSLRLRSIDGRGKPQSLNLEPLENLKNLSILYLFGRLEDASIISKFPDSLTYLTLSASGLKDDPMPSLGKLPNLKSLCFCSGSYVGTKKVCSNEGFSGSFEGREMVCSNEGFSGSDEGREMVCSNEGFSGSDEGREIVCSNEGFSGSYQEIEMVSDEGREMVCSNEGFSGSDEGREIVCSNEGFSGSYQEIEMVSDEGRETVCSNEGFSGSDEGREIVCSNEGFSGSYQGREMVSDEGRETVCSNEGFSGSYQGIEMVCSKGFPKLLVLKLWKLESLEKLRVEDRAMQNLTELEIRCCDRLEELTGLEYLKSLQKLKLTNMPENFTTAIEKEQWPKWNDIGFSPMIIKDNWSPC